ncbi:hypothetical protein [Dactylosporangium sp. NPDC051541]|uniref:hypothetical protein n=1 Tax=Dactylosporangium sp. NPDC051541 TaxID=3363977 RepID=UPI0037B806F8
MAEVEYESRSDGGGAREKASAALGTAGSAVRDTAGTAKDQAANVAGEAKAQARNLAHDVRDRVGTEARNQNDRLADGVRRFADELDEMVSERGDSPASKVVTQVSQGGRRIADYLAENGPEGVLAGVQDFARRKPGTFLLAAAAAGFVVGRLGKGVFSARDDEPDRAAVRPSGPTGDTQRLTPPPATVAPVAPVPVTPYPETPYVETPYTQPAVVTTTTGYPGPAGPRP